MVYTDGSTTLFIGAADEGYGDDAEEYRGNDVERRSLYEDTENLLAGNAQYPFLRSKNSTTTIPLSLWRIVLKNSMLGLLMTIMLAGFAIAGCKTITSQFRSDQRSAAFLICGILFALWYLVVYSVSWQLFGRICQKLMTRPEINGLFVHTIKLYSATWSVIGLVLAIVFVGWQAYCDQFRPTDNLTSMAPLWAFVNISLVDFAYFSKQELDKMKTSS